jgi:hypothetical protein
LYLFPVINIIQPVLCIQLRSVPSIMAAYWVRARQNEELI